MSCLGINTKSLYNIMGAPNLLILSLYIHL